MAAAASFSSASSPYRHIDPNDTYGFLFLEIGFVSDDQMELLSRAPILNEVLRPPPPAAAEPPPPPLPETVPPITPISHEQPLPSIVAEPAPATSTESSPHSPAIAAATATVETTPSMPRPKKKRKTAASVPATAAASPPVVWFRDLLPPLPQGLSIAETVDALWRERYPERDPDTEPKSLVEVAKLKGFWWHWDDGAGGFSSRR
ncbi:putative proline-rich receptor-like protein kinase PERK8 [Iris pallida]|uniref:Proline-rich receptor-like protein kinase PERK8 n=1 Tax=Iris pallida TaxID=29817 RepID=A0AAX6HDQ5_IRIPA|nr:putative proline-rich receptor-like protein kinase PERK8 [Iris pallida]